MSRTYKLQVWLSDEELSSLDSMRGQMPRASYVRRRVLGQPTLTEAELIRAVTQQDEPSAPIESEPLPPPKPKEELHLQASLVGAFEMRGKDWGTLRCGERECDLTGVELEPQADGSLVLRYSDRSLVRMREQP